MTVIVTVATETMLTNQSIDQSVSQSIFNATPTSDASQGYTNAKLHNQQIRPNTADEIYAQEPNNG